MYIYIFIKILQLVRRYFILLRRRECVCFLEDQKIQVMTFLDLQYLPRSPPLLVIVSFQHTNHMLLCCLAECGTHNT